MSSATMITDVPHDSKESLLFAQSESKAVGVHGRLIDKLRDNAPRIVAAIKLAMDVSVGLSLNPFLLGYTAFAGVGRILLILYGTKANQQKIAAETIQKGAEHTPLGDSWGDNLRKAMQPRHYPVESSAALSTVAEILGGPGYGISEFARGSTGYTPLILGIFAVWSYANILFGKEKKKGAAEEKSKEIPDITKYGVPQSLLFASSESKAVGFSGRIQKVMKDNPVLFSSIMQFGICIAMMVGGIIENKGITYVVAGGIGMIATLTQALLIRKDEFNIEGAQQEKMTQKTGPWERRVAPQPGNSLGLQPA